MTERHRSVRARSRQWRSSMRGPSDENRAAAHGRGRRSLWRRHGEDALGLAARRMPDPRLDIARVCKRFGPTIALDEVSLAVAPGRGARHRRRERRRQEHADEDPVGRDQARLGNDAPRRRAIPAARSPRRPPPRRRDGLPGADARPAPHGGREHPARRRAVAPRVRAPRRPARRGGRRARPASGGPRSASTPARAACPWPRSSSSRSRAPSPSPDTRVLVLDEPTSSLAEDDVRRLFATIATLRSRGPEHDLHLARARGGAGDRRHVHRAPRRAHGRGRRGPRRAASGDRAHDGRPPDGRAVPALGAHAGRRHCSSSTASPAW